MFVCLVRIKKKNGKNRNEKRVREERYGKTVIILEGEGALELTIWGGLGNQRKTGIKKFDGGSEVERESGVGGLGVGGWVSLSLSSSLWLQIGAAQLTNPNVGKKRWGLEGPDRRGREKLGKDLVSCGVVQLEV